MHRGPCRDTAAVYSLSILDLPKASSLLPSGAAPPTCTVLDIAWLEDAALAVAAAVADADGVALRSLFVVTLAGAAAEVMLEADDVCQVASEVDGAVVLGEQTWSMLRLVPDAVQRVRSP